MTSTASTKPPLRLGILGAANIARLFVDAARPSKKVTVAAVAGRDAERTRKFAADLGIARTYASYDALLADREIDAVYVPLPNNLHAEGSIRAADAGKHVLCEKPLAASAAEARAIFEAARRNRVHVVEGYPYRAQSQTRKMRELLADGAIGRIQVIQAAFGFPLTDQANIRMDPALAGGALMDAGSYPVSIVRTITGERPNRVQSSVVWAGSGVDRTLQGLLEFPSGVLAQISCSFATARHRRAFVVGDAGTLSTTYLNDTSADMPPLLHVTRGTGWDARTETIETQIAKGFLAEADAFADLVAHGMHHWPGVTPEESLDIAATLEALAESARTGTVVEIDQAQ